LQLSLFDERDLRRFQSPDFPNERLIVSATRDLAGRAGAQARGLVGGTERELRASRDRSARESPLRGAAEIGMAVGAVINAKKMAKHFAVEIRRRSSP